MTFDDLQKSWQSQQCSYKLTIDSDMLLKEVKRNKKSFTSAIFWRDVREIGCAVLLVPVFLYFGIKDSLWPTYWLRGTQCSIFMVLASKVQEGQP